MNGAERNLGPVFLRRTFGRFHLILEPTNMKLGARTIQTWYFYGVFRYRF